MAKKKFPYRGKKSNMAKKIRIWQKKIPIEEKIRIIAKKIIDYWNSLIWPFMDKANIEKKSQQRQISKKDFSCYA